jgi:hypothetical protein
MTDKRGMQARRERKLRRQLEIQRFNDTYTMEVLEDDKEEKQSG